MSASRSYLYAEVVVMIERLMDMEHPYGEPEYSKLSHEITRLRRILEKQLDREGVEYLEQLSDAYISQGSAVLRDAFADGFWCAVELMLEHLRRPLL